MLKFLNRSVSSFLPESKSRIYFLFSLGAPSWYRRGETVYFFFLSTTTSSSVSHSVRGRVLLQRGFSLLFFTSTEMTSSSAHSACPHPHPLLRLCPAVWVCCASQNPTKDSRETDSSHLLLPTVVSGACLLTSTSIQNPIFCFYLSVFGCQG